MYVIMTDSDDPKHLNNDVIGPFDTLEDAEDFIDFWRLTLRRVIHLKPRARFGFS